jgi:hypothetical protein
MKRLVTTRINIALPETSLNRTCYDILTLASVVPIIQSGAFPHIRDGDPLTKWRVIPEISTWPGCLKL